MPDITEEEIARAIHRAHYEAGRQIAPGFPGDYLNPANKFSDEGIAYERLLFQARAVLALLQPALERARGELTDEQDLLLMCAVENLRSADRNDRTVEAAWRMAEKMEAWRKAAAIRKG